MNEKQFQKIMQQKMIEFLEYGKELGFFDHSNANRLKERLQRIKFVQNNSIPGDAHTGFNSGITTITVNTDKTFKREDWFVDEVLFHELTHSVSGLAENEFETYYSWFIDKNIQKFMTEKEKKAFQEYSKERIFQYSAGYGVALLDDFVAQYMSQSMVQKSMKKIQDIKTEYIKTNCKKIEVIVQNLIFIQILTIMQFMKDLEKNL